MTAIQPQIGSVWIRSFPYYRTHQSLNVLVLGNSMLECAMTRVLLIYDNGTIGEELWLTSTFHLYTRIYPPPEERGES
jgi:hypothetical protein